MRDRWRYAFGHHPGACTCVKCEESRQRKLRGRSGGPGFPRRRRRSRRRLARRTWSGIKWMVITAFVLLVLGTGVLTAIHWNDGADFESALRMMTDDFRLLVACPNEQSLFSDFVSRGAPTDSYMSNVFPPRR